MATSMAARKGRRRLDQNRVQEEVLKLLASPVQPASRLLINQDKEIKYRLHFQNKLPQDIFTFSRIVAAEGMEIQIAIMDSNLKEVITSNPLASVKVQIVVVYGDFGGDGQKNWTEEEFKDNVVSQRDNRGPLLLGELVIKLNNGIGYLSCAKFTDNSSWTRSQKFRLAVRIFQNENIEERVQEGISKPFRVKDRRVESNQKHHPPLLADEVWRLENIMRDGVLHKRLEKGGIHTVHQFLKAFTMDPEQLRTLLCDEVSKKRISNKKWDTIIAHAKECLLGDNLCTCNVAAPQQTVDNWKKIAFQNPEDIHKMVDNLPQPITPINVPSVPGSSSLDPQIPYSNGKNHDEATTQVGLWHQPNAPHNEHSNVLFGPEDISVEANRVQSNQESSSFQEPEVSNELPVSSIPVRLSTATDTAFPGLVLPEPQNSDHPATDTGNEPDTDIMCLQRIFQEMSNEQDFSLPQQPAFFHGDESHKNHILDGYSFGTEFTGMDECMFEDECPLFGAHMAMDDSCTGMVDKCMLEEMGKIGAPQFLDANLPAKAVPTFRRNWDELVAGLERGHSISKCLQARRLKMRKS